MFFFFNNHFNFNFYFVFFFLQLGHPILKTLESTPNQWLVQMLYAFNAGNIVEFSNIWKQKQQEIQAQVKKTKQNKTKHKTQNTKQNKNFPHHFSLLLHFLLANFITKPSTFVAKDFIVGIDGIVFRFALREQNARIHRHLLKIASCTRSSRNVSYESNVFEIDQRKHR